ncbi:MAG: family 16 glycoside hydrolase [Phycisphaerae bacterium]
MARDLLRWAAIVVGIVLVADCGRSNDAELAKAKAEAEAAKAELAQLRAAESQRKPLEAGPTYAAVEAARPPGPIVFESSLSSPDTLGKFYGAFGQYGGRAVVEAGGGLKLGFGHTASMVWAKPYLGDRYCVAMEVQRNDAPFAAWVLKGPGGGNSPDSGYLCRLEATRFVLFREGREVQSISFAQEAVPKPDAWAQVEADVSGGKIEVRVNGIQVALITDEAPLTGPSHGRLGLYGTSANTVYRNLRIWSPEADTKRERRLTPPVTEKPLPNGELLYKLDLSAGKLGQEWWQNEPQNVSVMKDGLVLSGPNGIPNLICKQPLGPSLACEIELEYPTNEAVNFIAMLWFSPKPPESIKDCVAGWEVALPRGDGNTTIRWHGGAKDASDPQKNFAFETNGPIVASTAYYAPVATRRYVVRLEMRGDELHVFLDGGLVLTGKIPAGYATPTTPVFFGMRQIYGGSKVHTLRVCQVAH